MKRLLKGGRVVDPLNGIDGVYDVLIDGGRIAQVGRDLPVNGAEVVEIPAGLVVCPGFIDMHVHLREPGQEHKETVATGTASAVAGGFTAVACMPNTTPVNDDANVTGYILAKAAEAGLARVYPIGAVSRGSKGELLADIAELKHAQGRRRGARRVSRGPARAPRHPRRMRGAWRRAWSPARGGDRLPFHVAHMSARASLRGVRKGKEAGVRVTCEVAPHHFTLTDERLASPVPYDTNVKMNPPLREAADRDAMLAGIADGTVDAIATDHAPHHYDEKKVEFDHAPFGIVGLETAVSLSLDRLVHAGLIRLPRLVELLSVNPARILRVPGGTLSAGAPADITILAPELKVHVDAKAMRSRSKNTPFDGWDLRGGVAATIVGGRTLFAHPDARLTA
jgi:dihydroorotase